MTQEDRRSPATRLLDLRDEFSEFNQYCAFICDAVAGIAADCETLDPDTRDGLRFQTARLKQRAKALSHQLEQISGLSQTG